jgi:NAD(P)-dependent dehydrogenase (short-subunit alcohol dehydrogenase family)
VSDEYFAFEGRRPGAVASAAGPGTGASSGVGLETARQLAGQGGQIVMIARDQARGEHARSQVAEAVAGKPPVLLMADLSVQADIRRAAHQVKDRYAHADILVNNAGAAFSRREHSADGLELTWATNYLAPFLLTELLLPLLVAAPAGRIVNVVSEYYGRKVDLGNLQGQRKYSYFGAYRASKLGEVLFTTELARRIQGSGVTVVSVSPGPTRTNFAMPSGVLGVVLSASHFPEPFFVRVVRLERRRSWQALAAPTATGPGAGRTPGRP